MRFYALSVLLAMNLTAADPGFFDHEGGLLKYRVNIRFGEEPDTMPDGDAVHTDFHHRNVLRANGDIRAVIDWEGSRGGDRLFDLVTLAFTLPAARSPAGAAARVWRRVEAAGARPVIEAYVAHMALRQVDWSIRHHGPGEVGLWLDTAEEALARYG